LSVCLMANRSNPCSNHSKQNIHQSVMPKL
jgi:hypothetical protein